MSKSQENAKKPFAAVFIVLAAIVVMVVVAINRNPSVQRSDGDSAADDERSEIVIGFENAPRSSDPRLIGLDANSQYLEELRFLPLVSFHPDGSLRPIVAESIRALSDTKFEVKIRSGLTFANGEPISGHDVVATYMHMKFPKGFPPSPRKGAFAEVKSVLMTDSNTVVFALKAPDAAFPTNLVIGILPEEAVGLPPEEINGKGFESGPYVLSDRTDQVWVLTRNPAFQGSVVGLPDPQVDRVKFQVIKDSSTRYAALVRGDLDILQNGLDADKVVALQRDPQFEVLTETKMSVDFLGFNVSKPPLNDVRVRKAIALAINRDEILKFTLQGLAEKASGMFPSAFPWQADVPQIEFDPKAAQALLDEAGYPLREESGQRFSLTIQVTTNKTRIAIAKAIASQLQKVGLDVRVESLEFGVFMERLKTGSSSAWIASWTGFKDPDHLHFVFHSAMVPPAGANRGRYANPELDDLLVRGKHEVNPEARMEIYKKAQEIVAREFPYVFLWHTKNVAIVKKNVKGFKIYSDGRYASLPAVTKD